MYRSIIDKYLFLLILFFGLNEMNAEAQSQLSAKNEHSPDSLLRYVLTKEMHKEVRWIPDWLIIHDTLFIFNADSVYLSSFYADKVYISIINETNFWSFMKEHQNKPLYLQVKFGHFLSGEVKIDFYTKRSIYFYSKYGYTVMVPKIGESYYIFKDIVCID